MKTGILHCADDLDDPRLLVALYAFKAGEERTLRYTSIGSAALMVAYIMTSERGWRTRIVTMSRERAERYLAGRRELNVGDGI